MVRSLQRNAMAETDVDSTLLFWLISIAFALGATTLVKIISFGGSVSMKLSRLGPGGAQLRALRRRFEALALGLDDSRLTMLTLLGTDPATNSPAAGAEPAPAGRIQGGGQFTLQHDPLRRTHRRVQLCRSRHQCRNIRVQRPVNDFLGDTGFNNPSQRDPVRYMPHLREVVGEEDVADTQLLQQLVEQVQHLRLHQEIQCGDRFIKN